MYDILYSFLGLQLTLPAKIGSGALSFSASSPGLSLANDYIGKPVRGRSNSVSRSFHTRGASGTKGHPQKTPLIFSLLTPLIVCAV